jgi:hypothetical protein
MHSSKVEDGDVLVMHPSAPVPVVGLCGPTLVQHVRGSEVGPVMIDVDPSGWADLETPEEAREYVQRFNEVMAELIAKAWPAGTRPPQAGRRAGGHAW